MQQWTFVISLLVQVGVLIFSWVSITSYDVPHLLLVVMLLGIVQTIEFSAYLIMGIVAWFTGERRRRVALPGLGGHDADDAISLYMLQVYFWEPCPLESYKGEKFVDRYLPWVPIIVIFNWAMLAAVRRRVRHVALIKHLGRSLAEQLCRGTYTANLPGFPGHPDQPPWFPVLLSRTSTRCRGSWDWARCGVLETDKRNQSLAGQSVPSGDGTWASDSSFSSAPSCTLSTWPRSVDRGHRAHHPHALVWALYGVVALWLTPRDEIFATDEHREMSAYVESHYDAQARKNACYNILDLISKNSTGIL